MEQTRRQFVIGLAETVGAASLVASMASETEAALLGSWWLACPNPECDRIDRVDGGTEQHICSRCNWQMFYGPNRARVIIACPKDLHLNPDVETAGRVTSFTCGTCHQECQMATRDTRPDPPDRGR